MLTVEGAPFDPESYEFEVRTITPIQQDLSLIS